MLWPRGRRLSSDLSLAARSSEGSDEAIARFERETVRYTRGPLGLAEIALAWPGAGMVEMVPAFNCTELSTPMEIAEALEACGPVPASLVQEQCANRRVRNNNRYTLVVLCLVV